MDLQKLADFQSQINFEIEIGNYLIKTAQTREEVVESLRLRHLVFFEEGLGRSLPSGLDVDRYDHFFDHLIIVDKRSRQLIATYRVYVAGIDGDFYSKSEFDLQNLRLVRGPYMEMGRACVHPQFRRSIILTLLWRGISEYMLRSNSQVLMGCGSIKSENLREALILTHYFKSQDYICENIVCPPLAAFVLPQFAEAWQQEKEQVWNPSQKDFVSELLPPLLKVYLKAGAQVCLTPAWDRDFKCLDFLVVMQKPRMGEAYSKKYKFSPTAEEA